ncbi:GNAT family N-acetyltransferase [Permianibacter sp. IMCC34836]|uniref:GNAT family N-acetyltransferase n=1 Tax=Permianibacter fluminis TaxID=2738515 RepID=UPI001556681E|nr:GNAT family N-acetyltransferase [Permianibacter fluminis]NQD35679.1 GNAT family N-acetyltransferase [Permianibacter fluminis]
MNLLQTTRLSMRRMTGADASFLVQLLNQDSFLRFIGDKQVRNELDALRYLRDGPDAMYERYGFCLHRVALKDSDQPIGMCGLLKREQLEGPDIGFAFLTEHNGKGYGSEAAAAVLDYAFSTLQLPRVIAIANADNVASHRLLTKIGMQYQGLRSVYPGEPELVWFAKDREVTTSA